LVELVELTYVLPCEVEGVKLQVASCRLESESCILSSFPFALCPSDITLSKSVKVGSSIDLQLASLVQPGIQRGAFESRIRRFLQRPGVCFTARERKLSTHS
jgi:hypothetical protein